MTPPMADPPVVEITLREVYDAVLQVQSSVVGAPLQLIDHEARLRKIEARLWQIGGGAVVLGALVGNWVPELLAR